MDAALARSAIHRYERPADVADAYRLLADAGDAGRVVGGGTDLALNPPAGVTTLIDLARLPLAYIGHRDGRIAIGATTTLGAMAEDPTVAGLAGGLLGTVLGHVGSHALRNVATIGGHLARGHHSDLAPALLVLDADVRVFDGAEHVVPFADLYHRGWRSRPMVLTEVTLPFPEHTLASGFVRFSRTTFDYAILNCAVTLHVAADSTEVVEFARVAVGETPALARRVPEVEHFLTGRYLDPDTIDAAAALAQRHVVTGSDQRASAAYRHHLVGVGVRRALKIATGIPEVEP